MAYEDQESDETIKGSGGQIKSAKMTLQKAVDLGEYNPAFLSTFPEWSTLSRHVQLQFIKQGIDNRRRHLLVQWAEINNAIDFRLKPNMQEALTNIEKQLKKLESDKENLFFEYSK